MGIIIEDIQYKDKFRPTETDVDWTLYNVGEPIDIEIQYRVEEVIIAESQDYDDSGWVIMNPSPSVSGLASNSDVIYADNPNTFEFFYVGDTITIAGSKQTVNNGTYTIIEKIDNQTIRVNFSFTKSFLKTNGTIHIATPFKGIRYFYNFIENKGAVTYDGIQTNQEQQLTYNNATTGMGATAMVFQGNLDYQIEGATIEGNGTTAHAQKFIIKHSTVVTPLFLASQIADIEARIAPDYYDSGNCLKHIFRLEANRDLSNPNDTQEVEYSGRDGNTGWFNESYNDQLEHYTYSNLVLTRVSDAAVLDALELLSQVDVTFRVTNTTDTPFADGLTQGMGLFWQLPDLDTNYKNNGRTLKDNFVYDYALAVADFTPTIVNGDNFGTTLQAIEETEITFIDSSNIDVRIRFDFGSLSKSVINENDFKKYVIGFTTENESLDRKTSDKTTLLISEDEFYLQLFDSNLITNTTTFLEHRYTDVADSVSTLDVFPVDDVVAYNEFSIDFSGLENDGIDIESVSHELILTHATNADITVESNTYQTGGANLLNGYVPLIDVEQNRAFTITDNDFRKLVNIERDSANDSGSIYAYKTTYPFFVRWETWEALSVSNPPTGVYDTSLPNNGLNNFLYRYSTLGYTLNYRLRFTIQQNGEFFTQEFDSPLTMHDFNSNTDYNNEYIKSYDVATSTELISGGDKFLQGYVDTRLEAAFDKTVGSLPALIDIDIVFWIIGKEKGTIKSVRRASSFYADSGNTWFKGITSPNLVNKTKIVSLYEGKVLVDFTKLSGSEFTVYARLHDNLSGIPVGAKIMEDGTTKLMEDGTTKIID